MDINKSLVILFLCLFLLSSVSASTVYAQVSIKTTCYNSNSIVSENLRTENADYYGVIVLAPAYIVSDGAGKSVDDEFSEFYHSVFAANEGDLERIAAYLNLKTESGGYEWAKGVTASYEGLSMGMSVDCEIENGNLDASYHNSLSSHSEELMTKGARYSESTIITPSTIASEGIGNSLLKESKPEDDETDKEKSDGKNEKELEDNTNKDYSDSKLCACEKTEFKNDNDNDKNQDENADNYLEDENENSGFYHMIYVEGQGKGKWTEIRTNLTCESIDFDWKKSAKTFHLNSSMGMALSGGSKNGSVKILEMDGEASNFPAQHLPPGEVVISTVEPEVDITVEPEVDISEAANEFYDDFFQSPIALFYSIEQECFIPPGGSYQTGTSNTLEGDYFQLGMGFFLGPAEKGEE
jgi:hypothetical protein